MDPVFTQLQEEPSSVVKISEAQRHGVTLDPASFYLVCKIKIGLALKNVFSSSASSTTFQTSWQHTHAQQKAQFLSLQHYNFPLSLSLSLCNWINWKDWILWSGSLMSDGTHPHTSSSGSERMNTSNQLTNGFSSKCLHMIMLLVRLLTCRFKTFTPAVFWAFIWSIRRAS